jgi:hypothetical protein
MFEKSNLILNPAVETAATQTGTRLHGFKIHKSTQVDLACVVAVLTAR